MTADKLATRGAGASSTKYWFSLPGMTETLNNIDIRQSRRLFDNLIIPSLLCVMNELFYNLLSIENIILQTSWANYFFEYRCKESIWKTFLCKLKNEI